MKWLSISGYTIPIYLSLAVTITLAQSPPPEVDIPNITPNTTNPENTFPLPETPPPSPLQENFPTPPHSPSPEDTTTARETLPVTQIEIIGFTVLEPEITQLFREFTNSQGLQIFLEVTPFCHTRCGLRAIINQEGITFDELIQLRTAITQLYSNNNYVTSGAFVPNNQDLTQNTAYIQIVEGELEEIVIAGLHRLQEGYVRSRLQRAVSTPLNQQSLAEALQLLQLNPLLQRVNAELTLGSAPGRSKLLLELTEAPAFHAGVSFANNRSPSIGALQTSLFVTHDNLFGWGDRLSAEYGFVEGPDVYNFSYAIPVNALDGTLSFRFSSNDSEIVEDDFADLGINSEAWTFATNFRQPLIKTPTTELAVGLGLDLRRSQTFILDDEPFSFSVGPEDGQSQVTIIRFSQDWFNRSQNRVLAARSQFSFGIDAFDATVNDTGTDGEFFAWLGQFQWVEQLPSRILLVTRLSAQLTPDSLLSLEQFSIGGGSTVRGYRENQLVGDNGILGAIELRIPVTSNPNKLQLIPFFEVGTVWNNQQVDPDPGTIASVGLGLRSEVFSGLNVSVDYGIPLISVDNQGYSLQENGFHFAVTYQAF